MQTMCNVIGVFNTLSEMWREQRHNIYHYISVPKNTYSMFLTEYVEIENVATFPRCFSGAITRFSHATIILMWMMTKHFTVVRHQL